MREVLDGIEVKSSSISLRVHISLQILLTELPVSCIDVVSMI